MQSTIGSGGTVVDFEVRVERRPCAPDSSATAESEKVFSLRYVSGVDAWNGGEKGGVDT